MNAAQIADTLATLTAAMIPAQRPAISTGSCTTPGCTSCAKGGK
ncbi:hypothetical protein ACLQ2R_17040 [Streptosporangium sp. DT93]